MTAVPSIAAQIEAVRACIDFVEENIPKIGRCADTSELRAVLATLQQHERATKVVEAARTWRSSLANDGWTEQDLDSIARPGLYDIVRALAALDADETTKSPLR